MWQLLLFLSVIIPSNTNAVILKCETPEGTIYFNDRTCAAADIETLLPCNVKPLSHKEITKIEQQLRTSRNTLHKKHLQQKKQQQQAAKKLQQEQKRRLRNKEKCERVLRQIADVNEQYKEGYTIKQGKVLSRKLAKYTTEKQRFCNE